MLKVLLLMVTVLIMSGCATVFGENPEVAQARQQAEHAKQVKHDRLQTEVERLRSQIKMKKSELNQL